jgi:hypothetical protein
MLWSVAGRFSFRESELWGMSMRSLVFWYSGCARMAEEEKAAQASAIAQAVGGGK